MVTENQTSCLVVYDVADDRIRNRFSEACLDFGLERFQMSAFGGCLTATRRKELFTRLCAFLGKAPGRILVQPIGAEDLERRMVLHQAGEQAAGTPGRKPRRYPEPGRERPTILRFGR